MRFGYVTVIEAENEQEARAIIGRGLQLDEFENGHCKMIGGGASISNTHQPYVTGIVAAAIAADAFDGDEDECERLSILLHAEAIK